MLHEKSADTKVLENLLSEASVGQLVAYEEMSKAIGRDVRMHALSSLRTARQGLLKEKGLVFGVERGVGLKRLDDIGIVASTESDRRKMQRVAKRSLRKLAVVNFDKLPDDKKRQHVVASAQMGAIAMFSAKSASKKIESKVVSNNSACLPIGETLKLFGG